MCQDRTSSFMPVFALLCAACLLAMLLPTSATAATATVYGTGGVIVLDPPVCCPDTSSRVCAVIEYGTDPTHVYITDATTNQHYNGVLEQPFPSGVTEIQGNELIFESIVAVP